MKNKITLIAFAIGINLSLPMFAEDFVPQDSPALEAVTQLTEKPFVQQEVTEDEYVSAEEQIQEVMAARGWTQGWDAKKKRMFVLVSEGFDIEDPTYDNSFVTKRSQYSMIATMGAKEKVVEFMRTQMSAVDQLSAPGTDVHAELGAKYDAAVRKANAQNIKLEKMLREVDAAEADKLKGVTWGDRVNAYTDALIKKLDETYSTEDIEAKKLKKYEKAKQRYDEATTEMASLAKKAATLKGNAKLKSTSMVETLAKAPLMGTAILLQAESWNAEEEQYEVATLLVWSKKLEKAATAIITGESYKLKPKEALTVQQWLTKQELATMVGPRMYVDKDGERWFIGVYAMPYEGASSLKRKNKGIAELFAKKEVAMALYADIETQKKAEVAMETRNGDLGGKDHTEIATSFEESTRSAIENRQINGLSKLFSKTIMHPISKQKIYVVGFGISASSAANALSAEASAFRSGAKANAANDANNRNKPTKSRPVSQSATKQSSNSKSTKSRSSSKPSSRSMLNAPSFDEDDF